MTLSEFKKLSKEYIGDYLQEFGFSCEGSKHALYNRKYSDDVYHFIWPQLNSHGTWFDVMVFAHSPKILEGFYDKFQDNLEVTSDVFSFLHPITGVGRDQKIYRCNYKEGFIRNFNQVAKPAIEKFALPYLDGIVTVEDVLNKIPDHFIKIYNLPDNYLESRGL